MKHGDCLGALWRCALPGWRGDWCGYEGGSAGAAPSYTGNQKENTSVLGWESVHKQSTVIILARPDGMPGRELGGGTGGNCGKRNPPCSGPAWYDVCVGQETVL